MSGTPRTDAAIALFWMGGSWSNDFAAFTERIESELNSATAELAATKAELAKEKEDFWKAVANVGPCGACAEIIACGSTMHEHEGCAHAQLAQAKEQLRVAREVLSEALDLDEMDEIRESHAYQILLSLFVRLNNFTQPNLSADSPEGGNPAKGQGGVPSTFPA